MLFLSPPPSPIKPQEADYSMKQKITELTRISVFLILFVANCCDAKAPTSTPLGSTQKQDSSQLDTATLFGNWSRDPHSCKRPELSFAANRLTIQIDADGEPIKFTYTPISYSRSDKTITARLGKQHPYGHTQSKDSISFEIIDQDSLKIESTKFEPIKFTRCQKGMKK
jgi:hypothetical protein